MVDVAVVSVIASAGVAAISLAQNALGGRAQRKHEKGLAFQERVWDAKSSVMLEAIKVGQDIVRAYESHSGLRVLAVRIIAMQDFLDFQTAEIEAYGSKATRDAMRNLDELMERAGAYVDERMSLGAARLAKNDAVENQDFDRAALSRKDENAILSAFADRLPEDPPVYRDAARALVDAARRDLRDPNA